MISNEIKGSFGVNTSQLSFKKVKEQQRHKLNYVDIADAVLRTILKYPTKVVILLPRSSSIISVAAKAA